MRLFITCSLLLLASSAQAQIAIKDQPGEAFLAACERVEKEKLPSVADLLKHKPEPIPKDANEILMANDWVDLGAYLYHDKRASTQYGKHSLQWNLIRFANDGGVLRFSCLTMNNGGPACSHTNFTNRPIAKEKIVVKDKVAYLAQTAYGETDYSRVLRLRDGVLIVDITKSGRIGDKKVMFRQVYGAIPKLFKWSYDE